MWFYIRHCLGFFIQLFPCITLCYLPFEDGEINYRERSKRILTLIICVLTALLFPLSQTEFLANLFGHRDRSANLYMSLSVLGLLILFWVTVHENAIKKKMVICLVFFYASVQFIAVNMIAPLLPKADVSEVYSNTYFFLYVITMCIFLPVMISIMKGPLLRFMREIEPENMQTEFRQVLYLSLINILLIIYYATIPINLNGNLWLTPGPVFLLSTLILSRVFYSLFEESVRKKREEDYKKLLEISEIQYQNILKEIDTTKRIRHDMKQHMRRIHEMARQEHTEEIKKYISDLIAVLDSSFNENFCADRVVNGLLQYYVEMAREENISCSIHAKCEEVYIEDIDLTVLIGNIFENAIYACKMAGEDMKINVDIGIMGSVFLLQVKNTCKEIHPSGKYYVNNEFAPAEAFMSNKKNGGYGLTSIKNVAQKYDGEALFRYDDKNRVFITRIRLNFHPEIL